MASREEWLEYLWTDVIDFASNERALENVIANCRRDPDGPFGDTGGAIERLLAAGVAQSDLRLLVRHAAYEAVFGTLYALSDPGLEKDEDIGSLYEDLLTADPSGSEGRPGSADQV